MNQQVDNAEYEFLWKLLANPADPNHSYIFNLQSLVSDYPQSGALHALLMPNGDKRYVKHAAAYFNPIVLHKLATAPDSLRPVSPEQIIFSDVAPAAPSDVHFKVPYAEPFVPPQPTPETEYTQVVDDHTATETPEEVAEAHPTFAEPIEIAHVAPEPIVDSSRQNVPAYIEEKEEEEEHAHPTYTNFTEVRPEPEVYPEPVAEVAPMAFHEEYVPQAEAPASEEYKNEPAKEYEEYMAKTDLTAAPEPVSSYEEDQRYFHQPIEDEVYDEIVSIEDIGLEQLAILNRGDQDQDGNVPDENYFVFEPEIQGDAGQGQLQHTAAEQAYAAAPQQDQSQLIEYPGPYYKDDLSRYNDEKMPYSFMWWLDKTRKEHAYIYQPYAANSNDAKQAAASAKQPEAARPVVDELQKQYYQNIVSNTAFTDLDANAPKIATRKEDKIIERFIQEEPHIKHPTDIKLDNENKAKRSSEDKEELVTETLARIYTEQMLYHKAIITYKKLMLKYPEKSLYFAGQIEYLENKIN